MESSALKQLWRADRPVVNGWLQINSTWSAEIMAHAGFDSLTIDMQHGFAGYETMFTQIQVINSTATVPLVRVPWFDPVLIGRVLDAGSLGVICPMINTRAECEQFVGACRYYPEGYRSLGPTRPRILHDRYADEANREIVVMAMVETATALENVEEIASVPGLDAIYVGTGDLSLTLGGSERSDYTDPDLIAALDRILSVCQANGVAAGLHNASPEYAAKMIDKGFRFVTAQSDGAFLADRAKQAVTIMRREGAAADQGQASPY